MANLINRVAMVACALFLIIKAHSSPDAVVVFNEVHYNPIGSQENEEWIEIFNQMGIMTDVSGWRVDGIGYTIPDNTFIEPGEY